MLLTALTSVSYGKGCSGKYRPAARERGSGEEKGVCHSNVKMFQCRGSVRIQSSGAVQCEVCNWICLTSDHAQSDYFWCKSEKSSADRGGGNSEWFSRGEIHWCSLCSRYIVSSHPEIAKSVWSDGFSFYRLNTVKVNCHYFRLNPCDLVQETNRGVLQCYPCCALKWSGSEWVLLTEDQVNSSLLLFCCPFFFFFPRGGKTQPTEGSRSAHFFVAIVFLPFTL